MANGVQLDDKIHPNLHYQCCRKSKQLFGLAISIAVHRMRSKTMHGEISALPGHTASRTEKGNPCLPER